MKTGETRDATAASKTAAVRIHLNSQEAAAALVDYQQRCDCPARPVGVRIVEASAPARAQTPYEASLELESYLRVWRIINPEFRVRLFALPGAA